MKRLVLLLLLMPLFAHSAPGLCAKTITELKAATNDRAFPLRWSETTMNDGKPLVVSILEREGLLMLEFMKTREGLWVETKGVICNVNGRLEAHFDAGKAKFGPVANWLFRTAMANGGSFKISRTQDNQLEIATSGWKGVFTPAAN